jgi:Ca2+-binding EF-hand superfamily protein
MPQVRVPGKLNAGRGDARAGQPLRAARVLGGRDGMYRPIEEPPMYKTLFCTALVLATGIAFAQDASPERGARHAQVQAKAEARFAAADKDGNGRIDRTEAQAVGERMATNFDRLDANKDGGIDKAEMAAMRQKMGRGGHRMKSAMAYQRGLFVGMDDNADGAVTRAELGSKHKRWSDEFDIIDANRDGKITGEELRAWHQATMKAHRAARQG